PSLDPGAIESDYLETGFGKAAPAVKRYFDRLQNQWRAQAGVPVGMDAATLDEYRRVAQAYPREFRSACRADREEAYTLGQGRERERVVFLERGLHYVDLTLDAIEKTIPLLEAGWKLAPKPAPPPHPDLEPFRLALSAWEERRRYVETLKQEFVLSYLWIRYNDLERRFVPLEPMQPYWTAAHPIAQRPVATRMAEEWRSQIKQTFFVPDPLPPLEPEFHGRFEPAPGVIAERVTYGTEFGLRIPAILYLPKE